MGFQKKCKYCGVWNEWEQLDSDKCSGCGVLLAEEEIERAAVKKKTKEQKPLFLLTSEDKGIKRFFKAIARGGYLLVMWVVSVFMAILLWLPG